MSKSEAGKLGGIARMAKHGNPGTVEGRKKGALKSMSNQRLLDTGFIFAKKHFKPKYSSLLAEFIGIMIGDGHLAKYQVMITTNSETDIDHALYIKNVIIKLFKVDATLKFSKRSKAVDIIASSINLVNWLNQKGMPIGKKLKENLSIPKWIYKKEVWQKNFIRGLFDTDGCVYVDTHIINGKKYKNQGWAITSYSNQLRDDIFKVLKNFGYNPTLNKTQMSVYMRRKIDIERYFKEIGTSNKKHLRRYRKGRVPKRS